MCAGRRAPEIELIEAEELGSSLLIHLHILWNSDASATVSLFTPTCPANVFQSPQIARTQILGIIPLSQICKWQTLKVFVQTWPGHIKPTFVKSFFQIWPQKNRWRLYLTCSANGKLGNSTEYRPQIMQLLPKCNTNQCPREESHRQKPQNLSRFIQFTCKDDGLNWGGRCIRSHALFIDWTLYKNGDATLFMTCVNHRFYF